MKLRIIKEYKTEKKIISFFMCLKKTIFFFVKKKKIKTMLDTDAKKSATKILIARDKGMKDTHNINNLSLKSVLSLKLYNNWYIIFFFDL